MKQFYKKNKIFWIVIIFIIFSLISVGIVYALNTWDTGYRVNDGKTESVYYSENNICRRVTNEHGQDIFIPTRTTAEWNAFDSHRPSGVITGPCLKVVSFSVYDAFNDGPADPPIHGPYFGVGTINVGVIDSDTRLLSFRANTDPADIGSGSIKMEYFNYPNCWCDLWLGCSSGRTETTNPYTWPGDVGAPDWKFGCRYTAGINHRIKATPYPLPNLQGTPGVSLEIIFRTSN